MHRQKAQRCRCNHERHKWIDGPPHLIASLCTEGELAEVWFTTGAHDTHDNIGLQDIPDALASEFVNRCGASISSFYIGSEEDSPQDLGSKVCAMLESSSTKMVVLVNYHAHIGFVAGSLLGSLASHLGKHCSKPLVFLQPKNVSSSSILKHMMWSAHTVQCVEALVEPGAPLTHANQAKSFSFCKEI